MSRLAAEVAAAATAEVPGADPAGAADGVTAPRVTFADTLRSEWVKLRSLRSTAYTLLGLFIVSIGITLLATSSAGDQYQDLTAAERLDWDPTALTLRSYIIVQLIISVLGILITTSEYATGLIRTSLAATPSRSRLLAAKALLVTAIGVAVGQLLMFTCFLVGQAVLAGQDVPYTGLSGPGALSAVVGGGLYLAAIALLAVALGAIMRATAGALATMVGIVFVVPGLAGLIPDWLDGVLNYWPTMGAGEVMTTVVNPDFPHPWPNLGGMCLGIAAVLTAAFVLFRRRDV